MRCVLFNFSPEVFQRHLEKGLKKWGLHLMKPIEGTASRKVEVFLDQKKRVWFFTCVWSFVCYRESCVVKGSEAQPVEEKINLCHSREPQNLGVVVSHWQKPPAEPGSGNRSSVPLSPTSSSTRHHSEIKISCQNGVAEFKELHPQIPLLLPNASGEQGHQTASALLCVFPRIGFASFFWESLAPFL